MNDKRTNQYVVGKYEDSVNAEVLDDLQIGEFDYKYRVLDDVIMPPYITPDRYELSRNLLTRLGDICFTGYPKSGSTWLSYILLLLTRNGETPSDETLRSCLHWVASSFTYPRSRDELEALPSPRIFKSHMPYHMAFGGNPTEVPCKYIYIARNPRDVCVSYFYFESDKSWAGNYNGPWEHWLKMFLDGKVQRGDWYDHVLSWWQHRDADNILFIRYEDLREDFEATVTGIAKFLDIPLSQELLAKIKEKTSFQIMKQHEFSNMHDIEELTDFYRKGRVGSWKDLFTVAQNEYFDAVYQDRMKGSGLDFKFGK
jgi:hypothetical protein